MDDIPYNHPTSIRDDNNNNNNNHNVAIEDIPFTLNEPATGNPQSANVSNNEGLADIVMEDTHAQAPETNPGSQAQDNSLSTIQSTLPLEAEPERSIHSPRTAENLFSNVNAAQQTNTNFSNSIPNIGTTSQAQPQARDHQQTEFEDASIGQLLAFLRRLFRSAATNSNGDGNLADDEGQSFSIGRQPRKPKRQTKRIQEPYYHPGLRPKSPVLNEKKALIRLHFQKLLKIGGKKPLPLPPSDQEIQRFENGHDSNGHGPTIERYLIHYRGAPTCKWNERAFDVFFDTFMKITKARELFLDPRERPPNFQPLDERLSYEIAEKRREDIYEMWVTHFKRLRQIYVNQINDPLDPLSREKRMTRANRDSRRQTLFQRRLEISELLPEFRPHIQIIKQLGAAAVSSDESGSDDEDRVYTVYTRRWLNPMVRVYYRRLDEAYLRSRRTTTGRYTPGNLPHRRIRPAENAHVSDRDAVPLLPINVYNPDWYQSLPAEERNALKANPRPYDLSFPPPLA